MPGRIEAGFALRYRDLLRPLEPCRVERGVVALLAIGARTANARPAEPREAAFLGVYEAARGRVRRALAALGREAWIALEPRLDPRFLCDGSLGGLARWLRAAGYEARDAGSLRGDRLVGEARRSRELLLTTDTRLWERRAVIAGEVAALWVPGGVEPPAQLALVLEDLLLPLRTPRCMACGGELRAVDKHTVLARIPPRTARWKDDYFVCDACDQLFWRGTHWERIEKRLRRA